MKTVTSLFVLSLSLVLTKQQDVEYYLYTQQNLNSPFRITDNDVASLNRSNFNPERTTTFVVHGWSGGRNSGVTQVIRAALLQSYDFNVFIVDWNGLILDLAYVKARAVVIPAGQILGEFCQSIMDTYGLDGASIVLVGYDLGAHVAGRAGAILNGTAASIIGLDPAGSLYTEGNAEERLNSTDAQLVQVIHTNANIEGIGFSIGDIDFWPNFGTEQPGCRFYFTCPHKRAYMYFAEALGTGPVFKAYRCTGINDIQNHLCTVDYNNVSFMGEINITTSAFGNYYLTTNAAAPYARG